MKKKIISFMLTAVLALSSVAGLSGCSGDENYPVQVANIEIKEQPQEIVVLDAYTADIISYSGYDLKMVGRSDEVDQEWLSVVPSFGSSAVPSVQKMVDSGTDIVFAGEDLRDNIKADIEEAGITVITMSQAKTPVQLETNYRTIARIMAGDKTGAEEGEESYTNLMEDMEKIQSTVKSKMGSDFLYTVCYLYFEDNQMRMMTNGTYGDMLLSYTGAVNVAVNIDETEVDVNTLKVANPNFIFYSDETTLQKIRTDKVLSTLGAVKGNKTLMVTQEEMSRQGLTALNTLNKMCAFMYPTIADLFSTDAIGDITNSQDNTTATDTTVPATQAVEETTVAGDTTATEATTTAGNAVADTYGIKLTESMAFEVGNENDDIKAVQRRLFDLGYITNEEYITGYYGDISKTAVENFQNLNKLEATGIADYETLTVMFSKDAVKA